MALLQVAIISMPLHEFVHLPCRCYQLQKTEKYYFRVVPNGITTIPNFIQICPVVLGLNHAHRGIDMAISCTLCKEHTIKLKSRATSHNLMVPKI
jgi:hypothetical protein